MAAKIKKEIRDDLGHEDMAKTLQELTKELEAGSVVSIEGDWGRGKTDLMNRLHEKSEESFRIWIDPWAHKESLVLELLAKIQEVNPELLSSEELAARVAMYLCPLTKFGIGAAQFVGTVKNPGLAAPIKIVADRARDAIDSVKAFLDQRKAQKDGKSGELFVELVDAILEKKQGDAMIRIFIDDLDRCTPQAQVSLLEEIHSFTQSGARAVFFVAVDSTTLARSIEHHYGTSFNGHSYLEKIFTLRLNLVQMDEAELLTFARSRLRDFRDWLDDRNSEANFQEDDVVEVFRKLGRYATPRFIERIFVKAKLVLRDAPEAGEVDFFLLWLCLGQAYPETRRLYLHRMSQGANLVADLFARKEEAIRREVTFGGTRNERDVANSDFLLEFPILRESVQILKLAKEMVSGDTERLDKMVQKTERRFRRFGLV